MNFDESQARHARLVEDIRRHDHAYYVLTQPTITGNFTSEPGFSCLVRVEIPTIAWSLDNLTLRHSVPDPWDRRAGRCWSCSTLHPAAQAKVPARQHR